MTTDLILGTAGHIDHGKTSLVRALTGTDTDRLPEEKRRGITIELGFAELDLGEVRLGIVDVPGHERFVRNMLAGATSIDLALLAVAADDSVKPQTREHLDILRLLGVARGVVALTKCDLAEPEWLELVEQEVRELLSATPLADAAIIRTSVAAGKGLDALRQALAAEAAKVERGGRAAGPFRMAIDRVFSMPGHGTIVTGSVLGGRASVGDALELQPSGRSVRVRSLQNHNRPVEEVCRGQRAAVNLAGVRHDEVQRGEELASPGYLSPSRTLTVALRLLPTASRPLRHRGRVRVHLGAAESMAVVSLLEGDAVLPGGAGYAQLALAVPAVSVWGQPFIVRSESPVVTIGGGRVLDPTAPRLRRGLEGAAVAAGLASGDAAVRVSAAVRMVGFGDWQPADLARSAGIADAAPVVAALLDRGELVDLAVGPSRSYCVHRATVERVEALALSVLARLHDEHPLASGFEPDRIGSRLPAPAEASEQVLARLRADGRIGQPFAGLLALPGRGPQLSPKKKAILERIIDRYRAAAFQPPTIDEVRRELAGVTGVPELLELAEAQGRLVRVSAEYFLHAEAVQRLGVVVRQRLAGGKGVTVSEIRELLGTTRKYAVPLCEYLDRIGITRRSGDLRVLA